MRKQRHSEYLRCPLEASLDVIGGKWKGSILFLLLEEDRRFGEFLKIFGKITKRTLTNQLREL